MTSASANRRHFLRFLAGSPLLSQAWSQPPAVLSNSKEALNVMEFEEAARKALPPAHWGYLVTGVEDDLTVQANRQGFQHIQLRPRRLVDVTRPDLTIEL